MKKHSSRMGTNRAVTGTIDDRDDGDWRQVIKFEQVSNDDNRISVAEGIIRSDVQGCARFAQISLNAMYCRVCPR